MNCLDKCACAILALEYMEKFHHLDELEALIAANAKSTLRTSKDWDELMAYDLYCDVVLQSIKLFEISAPQPGYETRKLAKYLRLELQNRMQ